MGDPSIDYDALAELAVGDEYGIPGLHADAVVAWAVEQIALDVEAARERLTREFPQFMHDHHTDLAASPAASHRKSNP